MGEEIFVKSFSCLGGKEEEEKAIEFFHANGYVVISDVLSSMFLY